MASLKYRTTRPKLPPQSDRPAIEARINDNLIVQLRPFEPGDLQHVHRLRTQGQVMVNTSVGAVDADLATSQKWMDRFMPPNDSGTFNMMVWAKQDERPWENIGSLGCGFIKPVPALGYMLRTEWWGKSIATKAVQAFLKIWWDLERTEVEIDIADAKDDHERYLIGLEINSNEKDSKFGSTNNTNVVPEVLLAEIEQNNIGSQRVVTKCGFKYQGQETIEDHGYRYEDGKVVKVDGCTAIIFDYTLQAPVNMS